jgi:hypothetical protein
LHGKRDYSQRKRRATEYLIRLLEKLHTKAKWLTERYGSIASEAAQSRVSTARNRKSPPEFKSERLEALSPSLSSLSIT